MAATEEGSASSPTLEFSRFSQLPAELRTQVWQHALDEATDGRTIHVEVHCYTQATQHSCLTIGGHFCGQHGHCNRYRQGEPSHASYCMTDGYFARTSRYPNVVDPESDIRLVCLSLACRESRDLIVLQYSKILRGFPDRRRPARASRLVRCSPETDLLVITGITDHSKVHDHPGQSQGIDMQMSLGASVIPIFSQATHLFTCFREILSSFRHVGIDCTVDWPGELLASTEFKIFLFYLESLEHLYVWPDPSCWADVYEDGTAFKVVDDIQILPSNNPTLDDLKAESRDLLDDYARYVRIQNDHHAGHGEHWMPRPKQLMRVGCYSPGSWLRPVLEKSGYVPGLCCI